MGRRCSHHEGGRWCLRGVPPDHRAPAVARAAARAWRRRALAGSTQGSRLGRASTNDQSESETGAREERQSSHGGEGDPSVLSESVLCFRWPKYWRFNFSISPSSKYLGLISFRIDWPDLLAVQGTLKSLLQLHGSKASILQCSAFFMVQLSHPYTLAVLLNYHVQDH